MVSTCGMPLSLSPYPQPHCMHTGLLALLADAHTAVVLTCLWPQALLAGVDELPVPLCAGGLTGSGASGHAVEAPSLLWQIRLGDTAGKVQPAYLACLPV